MNPGEQFIQLARRRDPEQGVHRLIANVLVAVRNPHGHACQATRGETVRIPVECQFHLAVDEVDELVLRWVNMRRHEGAGFTDNSDGTGVNSPQKAPAMARSIESQRLSPEEKWFQTNLRYCRTDPTGWALIPIAP